MGNFRKILLHLDGRRDSRGLIECAARLADQERAELKLVDVLPTTSWPAKFTTGDTDQFLARLADTKQDRLKQLAAEFGSDRLDVSYQVLQGPTSIALIREAMRGEHDLLIKETKGEQSRRDGFFGTTAKRLLRKCPTPVLLVKPAFKGPFERIVAAVDVTSEHEQDVQLNSKIIQAARALCPKKEMLTVLHAWSLYGVSILKDHMRPEELEQAVRETELYASRRMDDLLIEFEMGVGNPGVHLVQGDPVNVIPAFVAEQPTDLLILGTVGRSGVAGFLMGNTAEQILERVACSVLAVKPPGFVTPIRLDA